MTFADLRLSRRDAGWHGAVPWMGLGLYGDMSRAELYLVVPAIRAAMLL